MAWPLIRLIEDVFVYLRHSSCWLAVILVSLILHEGSKTLTANFHRKLTLLAVGGDLTLPDGEALAGDDPIAGETAPAEGRTKPRTTAQRQLQLAL